MNAGGTRTIPSATSPSCIPALRTFSIGCFRSPTSSYTHNLAPATAGRLGLTASALRPRSDRLVVCEINGYGEGVRNARRKAYDLLIKSNAGLLSMTGTPGEPSKAGISIIETSSQAPRTRSAPDERA